jgi:hypothetical protein
LKSVRWSPKSLATCRMCVSNRRRTLWWRDSIFSTERSARDAVPGCWTIYFQRPAKTVFRCIAFTPICAEIIRELAIQLPLLITLSALLASGSATSTPQALRRADLLRWLGCLTQKEAIVGLDRSFSGPENLRTRYILEVQGWGVDRHPVQIADRAV